MKAKTKWIVVAVSAIIIGGGTFSGGYAQTKSVHFNAEKAVINSDLEKVGREQEHVNATQKSCREKCTTGTCSKASRTELKKAKADLNREKAYLRADKQELLAKHGSHISEHRNTLRDERFALVKEKFKLDMALAGGKPQAVKHAETIVDLKYSAKNEQAKLKQAKLDRNADLLAVNKQISDKKAQPAAILFVENTATKAQNLALK
jgi:hypothetical protein